MFKRVYILDGDALRRSRLKRALEEVAPSQNVSFFDSYEAASLDLLSCHNCDVAFISDSFSTGERAAFITKVRTILAGKYTAFVFLGSSSTNSVRAVTEGLLSGFSAFLFEPFSVDDIVKVLTLAKRASIERKLEDYDIAFELLSEHLFALIDIRAALLKKGHPAKKTQRTMEEVAGVLKALPAELLEGFAELAEARLAGWGTENPLDNLEYNGISKRVMSQVEDALLYRAKKESQKKAIREKS